MTVPFAVAPISLRVLETLPLGVVVLNAAGKVVFFNEYEERLARRSREDVLGRDFFHEVAPCMNVRELGHKFRSDITSSPLHVRTEFAFDFPFNEHPRDVIVRLDTLIIDGAPFACILVEDVSAVRAVDRMRETLADLLVHDLKNPLSALMANVEFVRGADALRGDGESREALADAYDSGKRLERMLLNLLDLTRLSTGTFPLRRAPTDLHALLHTIAAEATGLARQRDQTLAVEGAPLVVSVDADVMRRAIDNLLENALRYSPHKGRVVLRVSRIDQHYALEVADDGPGMTDAQQARVFERFQTSGDTSRNRGLGLSFVQLAARAHGGEATVSCPGRGCVFRVTGLLSTAQ